jgi:hypothetical protein
LLFNLNSIPVVKKSVGKFDQNSKAICFPRITGNFHLLSFQREKQSHETFDYSFLHAYCDHAIVSFSMLGLPVNARLMNISYAPCIALCNVKYYCAVAWQQDPTQCHLRSAIGRLDVFRSRESASDHSQCVAIGNEVRPMPLATVCNARNDIYVSYL